LHSKPATVKVSIGCYRLDYLKVRKIAVTPSFYKSFTAGTPNKLQLIFPPFAVGATGTIDLSKIIEFYSDIEGCSEFSLISYTNSTKSEITTTTGTYFVTNPILRDLSTGALPKILSYKISSSLVPTEVFIKATTNP
jgi:hypothetical protein